VQLARLEDKTVAELRSLLEEIAEARDEHLLLDLRGVAGGSSEAAYQAADLFVSGQLGALQRRSETLETFTGEQAPVWQGRLVVLIDRATQGAGEILAAVLQQAAAADLVGERTFGHAGRQSAVSLSTGGELFLTDAFYTGPDNEPLNSSLVPEVAVTEGNRNLSEADVPLRELILRRGLERLREEEEPELEQVA
jgi:carboxyl-terminal processing protease